MPASYTAPVRDSLFVIEQVLGPEAMAALDLDEDLVQAIVTEAARFTEEVIAPLNAVADREGCTLHPDGSVTTPTGFPDAHRMLSEAGWASLAIPEDVGGQGLPYVLAMVMKEYLNSACHGFAMYSGLAVGGVNALRGFASEDLKARYIPPLASGEWLGTMDLTEPHSGTDLGLMRARAVPQGDGSYLLSGEKIFCSGGEQDLTENIVHLVLAKVPDAPAGSRGISLFLVPKFLPDGTRNAMKCTTLEHKMGVHGSATCAMHFDGAKCWLVGEENNGLAVMFIMMNSARLSCGIQGMAHAQRAYENAAAYACERLQGRDPGAKGGDPAQADPLIVHPDVRRMLMDAKGFIEGFRALAAWTALQIDLTHRAEDPQVRKDAEAMLGFLTPVIKGFGTDRGFQTTVEMQQIFGGHGYVTEWGMDQFVRDSRVSMIYEGANGVQALDLAGRKTMRDGGEQAKRFFGMISAECDAAAPDLAFVADPLGKAVHHGEAAAEALIKGGAEDPYAAGAGGYPYMELVGTLALGLMWLRIAQAAKRQLDAGEGDPAFLEAKLATARFYAEYRLPLCTALRHRVKAGSTSTMALTAEQFASVG